MFTGWSTFYSTLGEASATLIGLLFVVATLTSTVDPERRSRGLALFLTPTVFKFGSTLALSAVALAPGLSDGTSRWLAAGVGVVGVLNLGGVSAAFLRHRMPVPLHWSDPWCYGVIPTLLFLALAVCPAIPDPAAAARGVALATVSVLLLAARNAWDLVTAITGEAIKARAREQAGGERADG